VRRSRGTKSETFTLRTVQTSQGLFARLTITVRARLPRNFNLVISESMMRFRWFWACSTINPGRNRSRAVARFKRKLDEEIIKDAKEACVLYAPGPKRS